MPRYAAPAAPPQSDDVWAYERGAEAVLISGATGTVTQTGTAKPAAADAVGIVACRANSLAANAMVQVDTGGTGSWTALTVNLLGSLDGVNFYVLATFSAASGGIFPVAGAAQARYLSASITTATIASLAPTATVSIAL